MSDCCKKYIEDNYPKADLGFLIEIERTWNAGFAAAREQAAEIAFNMDVDASNTNSNGELSRHADSWLNGCHDAQGQISEAIREMK